MPKKYGVKEKDLVVSHVVNLILTGKLRSGDRVDRNEIAQELGVSRVPIQEAVVQLEHDGILSTQYHRGAFVELFDESVVREHHEIYGMLSGLASARVPRKPRIRSICDNSSHCSTPCAPPSIHAPSRKRPGSSAVLINEEYSGPRLLAVIRGSQSFMPRAFWMAYVDNHGTCCSSSRLSSTRCTAATATAARTANKGRAEAMGRIMLAELVRRGVLRPAGAPADEF